MPNNKENVLVIAAHPDDEVLGCGGTIARLYKEGYEVYTAILGEGILSRYYQEGQTKQKQGLVETLRSESQEVSKVLGMKDLFLYDLPDNRFDSVPLLDVVKIIEALVKKIRPKVIYTHNGGDLNIDHTVVHRAVMTATRPASGCPVKALYAFEVPSSTEWSFGQFQRVFTPNVFMDISETMDIKIEAMEMYKSEVRAFPHPRSVEVLRATGLKWGSAVGVAYAEAFELIREIQ